MVRVRLVKKRLGAIFAIPGNCCQTFDQFVPACPGSHDFSLGLAVHQEIWKTTVASRAFHAWLAEKQDKHYLEKHPARLESKSKTIKHEMQKCTKNLVYNELISIMKGFSGQNSYILSILKF